MSRRSVTYTRSLQVAIIKGQHIVPDTRIADSLNLPVYLQTRLKQAYNCPYRNAKLPTVAQAEDPISASTTVRNKPPIPRASSGLFTSNSIVNSSKVLKNQSITTVHLGGNFKSNILFSEKTGLKIPERNDKQSLNRELWIAEEDINSTEEGNKFIYAATYGRYLNIVFGIGGWSLFPLEDIKIDSLNEGFMITRKFGLVSHGQLCSETYSEFVLTRKTAKYGIESIRSKAIAVLAQKIGLGLSLNNNPI